VLVTGSGPHDNQHVHDATVVAIAAHIENALYGIDMEEDANGAVIGVTGLAGALPLTSVVRIRGSSRHPAALSSS
jgi:hypothetical protein